MSNKYLFNEEPKSFAPTIAKALKSVSKAVIMQQIHFWVHVYAKKADSKHFFLGHYWVFNSYTEWHRDLDFIPFATMKRQILELEKVGLLISSEFNKNRGDRTKWYRINYEQLTILTTGVELNSLVHFEPPSVHFEPPSDHFEPPSDHFDPLYIQSDQQIDHQNDQQKNIVFSQNSENLLLEKTIVDLAFTDQPENQRKDPPQPPLSLAALNYKNKFEDRFSSKVKNYWQRTISDRPEWRELLTEWASSSDCKLGFKNSLIKAQIAFLKKRDLPCDHSDAVGSLSNYIKNNDLASFDIRVDSAIAIEQSQTQRQHQTSAEPERELITYAVPSFVKDFVAANLVRKSL